MQFYELFFGRIYGIKLYIKDLNIIGLVKKYLKVGVLDNGELIVNEEGSAQGNIISPILANIYMHNVLTLCISLLLPKNAREIRAVCGKAARTVL